MPSNLVEWAIVIVAAVQCLTFLVTLALLLLLLRAFFYVRHHAPLIINTIEGTLATVRDAAGNVKETTVRVQGTAGFLTDQAVRPVILTAGTLAAIGHTVRALLIRLRRRRPRHS
ncbi:MAG: hypothetical protein HY331_05005 [Chloroflexi bacterium]|nr:hypothetical protein [Chloroflexota bacterium]